jgi:hypothetical protein
MNRLSGDAFEPNANGALDYNAKPAEKSHSSYSRYRR